MSQLSMSVLTLLAFSLTSLTSLSHAQDQLAEVSDSLTVDSVTTISIPTIPTVPATVSDVSATDKDNDGGGAIVISWTLSATDVDGAVSGYKIMRSEAPSGPFAEVGSEASEKTLSTDNKAEDGVEYYYHVVAYTNYLSATGEKAAVMSAPSIVWGPVTSSPQWFNSNLLVCLLLISIVIGAILFFISQAKSGKELYVRKIAGIDAIDEAVGRATEMGRKIFFIPGIQDMNDVQTIAGIAILGRVAQVAAEYDTWLEVPVSKSLVMVTARETMKEAYAKVGKPDAFNEAQVHFVTDDQFGYAAALDGMFVREKPATIIYMGAFFAESLILAETGNEAGAIQIAGTAMPSQLPFFVAACDYTLIGEELFAASAYLSREPRQLGSLKGQDFGKLVFMFLIVLGIVLELAGVVSLSEYVKVTGS